MAWFNDDVDLIVTVDNTVTTLEYRHEGDVIVDLSMCHGRITLETYWKSLDIKEERDAILDAMTNAKAVIRAYEKSKSWSDAWLIVPPVHGLEIKEDRYESGVTDTAYMIDKCLICNLTKEPKVKGHSYVSFYGNSKCNPEDIALLYMFAKKQLEKHEKALEEKNKAEERKRVEEDRVRSIVTEEREAFLTDLLRRMGYCWEADSKWVVQADGKSAKRNFSDGAGKYGYIFFGVCRWLLCRYDVTHIGDEIIVCSNEWSNCNE